MAGETTLTIVGNLTADPEIRTIGSGATVANFTVASTPRAWNRQTNQYEDGQALFMRCSAWRDMADHIAQSLKKGTRVIVMGRLQQRSYQAQDGANRTIVELQVDEIGPSLRYAVAAVARQSKSNGVRQGQSYSGGSTYGNPQQSGWQQAAPQPPRHRPIQPATAVAGTGPVGLAATGATVRRFRRGHRILGKEKYHGHHHRGHSGIAIDAEPS